MYKHEELKEGIVHSYTHKDRVVAVVELRCKTDFAARTDEFKTLAHEIAMQIAATSPSCAEDLLEQPWIKDGSKTVADLMAEVQLAIQEPVSLANLVRMELGA